MEISKHGIKAVDGSVIFRTAADVNAEFINAGLKAPYKIGSPVTEFVTSESEQFVRVFTDGITDPDGRWIVKASDIAGMTPTQIKNFLSLPNVPNKVVTANIPSGTKLRTGVAGSVPDFGTNGGVTQFEIPHPDFVNASWFNNIQSL